MLTRILWWNSRGRRGREWVEREEDTGKEREEEDVTQEQNEEWCEEEREKLKI